MPIPLRKSAGGFRSFGAVNRAIVLQDGAEGLLQTTGTALTLGAEWSIEFRVRHLNPAGSYVAGYMQGQSDIWWVIFNYADGRPNTYDLYCPAAGNASGTLARLELSPAVPSTDRPVVKFAYAGNTLNGYLDGVPAGSLVQPNLIPTMVPNAVFRLATRPGNAAFSGSFDWLRVTSGGVALIDLSFNEAEGNAVNAGSLGGEMTFSPTATREIL